MTSRYIPILESPLILYTDEVALQILRCTSGRSDRRAIIVRRAVEAGELPAPLNPQCRIDKWRFSVPQIMAKLEAAS